MRDAMQGARFVKHRVLTLLDPFLLLGSEGHDYAYVAGFGVQA